MCCSSSSPCRSLSLPPSLSRPQRRFYFNFDLFFREVSLRPERERKRKKTRERHYSKPGTRLLTGYLQDVLYALAAHYVAFCEKFLFFPETVISLTVCVCACVSFDPAHSLNTSGFIISKFARARVCVCMRCVR